MPTVNLTNEEHALLVKAIDSLPIQGIDHMERWVALGKKLRALLPKKAEKG